MLPSFEAFGGDGVDVALAEDDVVVAADLDLVAVLGVEQHLVAGSIVRTFGPDGHDLGPGQPLAPSARWPG